MGATASLARPDYHLCHHEGRNTGYQRGTSKREDALDSMIGLKKRDGLDTEDTSAFELKFTKAREFYGRTRPR